MKTAEEIIISKRFFELSPAEREAVKDYAANEEDYEAMRWFLISAGNSFTQEKIEPSAQLRKNVLTHLNQKQAAPKTIWLNGVGAFLFPAEKPFYRAPAFQMAAVAAVVVSVVMVYNTSSVQTDQDDLAINQKNITVEEKSLEQPTATTTVTPDAPADANAPTEDVLENRTTLNDQTATGTSSMGPPVNPISRGDFFAMDKDAGKTGSVEDTEYEKMSVAEEVKLSSEINELQEAPAQQQTTDSFTFYPHDGAYNSASSEQFGSGVDRKMDLFTKDELSKEKKKNEGDTKVANNGSGNAEMTGGYATVAPASGSTTVTTTETTAGDDGTLKYNVNGTVSSADNDSTTRIADLDKQADAKFSISETKALKKLFKVMR